MFVLYYFLVLIRTEASVETLITRKAIILAINTNQYFLKLQGSSKSNLFLYNSYDNNFCDKIHPWRDILKKPIIGTFDWNKKVIFSRTGSVQISSQRFLSTPGYQKKHATFTFLRCFKQTFFASRQPCTMAVDLLSFEQSRLCSTILVFNLCLVC